MEYPLSEIIDRLSILQLKLTRLPADDEIKQETARFLVAFGWADSQKEGWLAGLYEINGQIWNLEAEIRQGVAKDDGLTMSFEAVGRRALAIRELNKERIRRKNEIARAMGEFEEVKVDHASA